MFRKMLLLASLMGSSFVMGAEYNLELPTNVPINQIEEWLLNIAIVDQVCKPFPDKCISALDNDTSIISNRDQFQLTVQGDDQSIFVNQNIVITALNVSELTDIPINKLVLFKQINKDVSPDDQASVIDGYL